MPSTWPRVSYFNSGTADARHKMGELDFIERANWCELYRHKADGSYWRLDADDKYQQRFMVRIDEPDSWDTFDSGPLEKALLLEHRGGLTGEVCLQQGCSLSAIGKSAFCLDHTYERGVRK